MTGRQDSNNEWLFSVKQRTSLAARLITPWRR
jgi:hypothetical protein